MFTINPVALYLKYYWTWPRLED